MHGCFGESLNLGDIVSQRAALQEITVVQKK
jgi:hypothetical protein